MLGNSTDAEDVTQDVFVQVVHKLPTFRGEAALSTWLYRVAVNAALAFRRKKTVRDEHRSYDPREYLLGDGRFQGRVRRRVVTPEQEALARELHERIESAIARLPAAYRNTFVLADVDERPAAEIAASLGLTVGAVKSRLHRARLLMRASLARYLEGQTTCVPAASALPGPQPGERQETPSRRPCETSR
jgi:RNA polymerase sigma-70 factor (ECF subfamily)